MKFVMIVFLSLSIGCASVKESKGHNCVGWKDFEVRHGRIFPACTRSVGLTLQTTYNNLT